MSSRIVTLNKPGLYVAEHNSTGKQFLVSIGGELPMLRVINIINLSDFVSGFYADSTDKQKLQDDMEAHPNTYTYSPLQVKLERKAEEVKEDVFDLSKYSSLIENKDKLLEMDDNMAVINICKNEGLDIATATEIWKQLKLSLRP
jgi:hypothetical protein